MATKTGSLSQNMVFSSPNQVFFLYLNTTTVRAQRRQNIKGENWNICCHANIYSGHCAGITLTGGPFSEANCTWGQFFPLVLRMEALFLSYPLWFKCKPGSAGVPWVLSLSHGERSCSVNMLWPQGRISRTITDPVLHTHTGIHMTYMTQAYPIMRVGHRWSVATC